MKRKHKIVIATGVISLSMITAMATGLINTGNLFAEDPTTLSTTVFNGFQAGDKVILGGKEFVVLNPKNNKFLSLENATDLSEYSNVKADIINWLNLLKTTGDGNSIINADLPSYMDLGGIYDGNGHADEMNSEFVEHIGNGSVFWTETNGEEENTIIAINEDGNGIAKEKVYRIGVSQASYTCEEKTKENKIEINYIKEDNEALPNDDVDNKTTCVLTQKVEQITDQAGYWPYITYDNENTNITEGRAECAEISSAIENADESSTADSIAFVAGIDWQESHPIHENGVGCLPNQEHHHEATADNPYAPGGRRCTWLYRSAEDVHILGYESKLINEGDECNNVGRKASKAAVRPMITADLSSVLFVSENGTPVDADPQNSAVSLTLLDNDINFALAADQLTAVEAANSDTIKVKYDAGNITTGSNQNIKVIVLGKDASGNDKIIRYETLENLTSTPSGEVSIDLSSKGLNLPAGKYTLQLFNEQDNSAKTGKSNHASAMQEISLDLSQGLEASDVVASGDKVPTSADFYNEKGVTYSISGSANQAILNEYDYIRIGTLAELNGASPTAYQNNKASYTKDGVFEKVQEVDDSGNPKVDEAGDPVYNYDNCLYIQLANGSNTADPNFKATTMLRLDSVKIDSKEPYFPSGKNGEDKPIEIKNIKDDTPSSTSFFSAVFGLDQPDDDLEEEFGGGHIKLIPYAKDFAASDYNADGSLKNDAKALDGGIASYKLEAKVLDVTTGLVDDTKAVVSMTIDTNDKKFTDVPEDPYFELNGEEAYWVKLTAVDRAGREKTIERKLYMDDSVAAEPKVEANSITKNDTGDEVKTKYEGGLLKDENGDEIANWVGKDIQIDLSLTAAELADVKSGIDHYEYATKADIEQWLKDTPDSKREDYDGWISLGKKKDDKGDDTKEPETIFKTDAKIMSMNDEYYFRAVSRAGIAGKESSFVIKMDKEVPNLEVKAINAATKDEYKGELAKKGVIFNIIPKGNEPVSGVKYYYRGVPTSWTPPKKGKAVTFDADPVLPTDEEIPWIEIVPDDEEADPSKKYSILVTDDFDGIYYFRSSNGANVTTKAVDMPKVTTAVGVEQPKTPIEVTATVGDADDAYDGKWTNKDITLTLTGGLDEGEAEYYEYATERTSTKWTKIEKDALDGSFKLTIKDDTVNSYYYFRVVKKEIIDGAADYMPYSTTKTGLRIRHDANAPMFVTDGVRLTPEPPAIATSFVTLSIEMKEKSAEELRNCSPIAAYSVDDGATWIPADSKDSRKFTYDFKDNTADIKIKVKDEAGNITAYDTVLNVDNIDKTGPSAPKFPTEFINGEWKNTKQTKIPITFEAVPTGAAEWIQYHVQKLDGDVYKEYDLSTKAFLDEVTWIGTNTPLKKETVDVVIEEEGSFRIIARTIDSMNRVSAESMTTGVIKIDFTAPNISDITEVEDKWAADATSFLNAITAGNYFKDHITYRFTGSDNVGGSGLEKYQYQLADKDASDPDDTKWVDAYQGEVNIEEDFTGKLFVRCLDYAGNISEVKQFDGIQVDATSPTLTASPEKLDDGYSNRNSVTITAKDQGSGIKDMRVQYETDYNGTDTFRNGELILSAEGTATLNNLPNGNYGITFTALDNSGHTTVLVYAVMIDTETPEIAIIDPNPGSIVSEKEITIEVREPISGLQSLEVTLDGKELTDVVLQPDKKPSELSGENVLVYTAKVTSSGTLNVKAVSNSSHGGTNATVTESLAITNVYNVKPKLKVEAYTGKDESQDKYIPGNLTTENIEIVLKNTEQAIKDSDLTFQYREYKGSLELTNGWTNTTAILDENGNPINEGGKFSVYENGRRTYLFRAVMLDPDDPKKPPILESNTQEIEIFQDTKRPDTPVLDIANDDDYTQLKWYYGAQTMRVNFTKNPDAVNQWIEYKDISEGAKATWKKVTTTNAAGQYEFKVTGDKEHIIYIRSNDTFNRMSDETNAAYVNIDASVPDFDVKAKYTGSKAELNLITVDEAGKSTIGISGIKRATITKLDDSNNPEIDDSGNLKQKDFYNKKTELDKNNFGNGNYRVTLTTNSGKTVEKDIVIDGIALPKPTISVKGYSIAGDGSETDYTSGKWTNDSSVRLEVEERNAGAGSPALTYEYQEDGDKDWIQFAENSNEMTVTGTGKHAINIRAKNASGGVSEIYYYNVWIDDTWDNSFNIMQEGNYTAANPADIPWYNSTQVIQSEFNVMSNGCKEWIEYSEDGGVNWKHNSRNTYEVSTTGAHEIMVRKNDELNSAVTSGRVNTKTIHVNIDKEMITDFKVKIDKDSYSSFLSTITFGIYHNEAKKASITGNFNPSGAGKIYYQIVNDPTDYVNRYADAADPNDKGWREYTAELQLDNDFKGFIYAKAKDKAGNISPIIRTDGIVIDTIGPAITIGDDSDNWITGNALQINVSDFADGVSTIGNASGITSISYETDEAYPVEGTADVEDNKAFISGLRDGQYQLTVTGSDRAGNETIESKEIKVDRSKPTLKIDGYSELSLTTVNHLVLTPNAGVSGIQTLKVKADLYDGTSIDETLDGPNYTYAAAKNGTYTFTLINNAGSVTEEVLEVNNISDNLNDIMGLDIRTRDADGKEIDYLHAEELPGKPATPAWSADNIEFQAHGTTKFRASVNDGRYMDFNADGTFLVEKEGIHTVRIKNDADTTTRTFVVKIDKKAVQNVAIIGADDEVYTANTWFHDKNVLVQATYTPDDTGIDEWLEYYDASESKWKRGDSVTLSQEGTHTVRFRGNDELNRPTEEKSVTVNIDQTAPTDLRIKIEKSALKEYINHLFPNIFDTTVNVTIHANGDISGNKKIEYQIVNEETGDTFNDMVGWKEYTDSFTIPDGFKGKIYARATDNAGNKTVNAVTEDGIIVDTLEPEITFQTTPSADFTKNNTVKATINPTLSGLQKAWYTITKNGITTSYDIDLKEMDASNNITLTDLPDGTYDIVLNARNKAGKTGTNTLHDVKIETRAPLLKVDADLTKKASSIPVTIDVDMGDLYSTLTALTWQTSGTSAQDILADKSFTIRNNGVYKIKAETSSGVTAEKTLVVTNITNVTSSIGINAYYSETEAEYTGGDTWSDKDITIEARDLSGVIPEADLKMEMKVTDLKDNTSTEWTAMEADKKDSGLYKTVVSKEGSYVYEFRGSYEDVPGSSAAFQVNIDRSAPKKPLFDADTVSKYDNDRWHSEFSAELKAEIDATEGCDEWLEYNIDGATDFDGNKLWTPTLEPVKGTIRVVDDKDHIVEIRTKDRLGRISDANEIHVKLDSTRPTNFYIKEGEDLYQDFLDKLTGGKFYKESRTIEIGGNFKLSGVERIEYQIVEKEEAFDPAGTWTKVNVAKGAESGTFPLMAGTKGMIYARGVDKAGNETGIIRSDLITIDNTAPLLKVPADATEWTNDTTMKIGVKDDMSGIKSVKYSSEAPAQSGDVTLTDTIDADGYREGIIRNLKDGNYKVEIIVTDNAGITQTLYPIVKIDTVKPDLKVEGQTSKPQASVTLDLIPVVGGSGLQEIQRLEKQEDGSFEVKEIISAVKGKEAYPYEFIENGTYYFQVVNGKGDASDRKEITISTIKSDKPVIVFRTDNGYEEDTWSGKPVRLEVHTNTNAKLSYRKVGDAAFTDASKGYYQNLTFNQTGTYTYEFRSEFEGIAGADPIVTTQRYTVKVDLEAPKKPQIENAGDYEQWFHLDMTDPANPKGKTVTVIRDTSEYPNGVQYGDGSKETLYYHIDGENEADGTPKWIEMNSDSVMINKVGDHVVTFKLVDEVAEHETLSDPIHVKIYDENPSIELTSGTKPVKSFELGIEIKGITSKKNQIRKLTVERVGSEPVEILAEQGISKYKFPINKNGNYIVRVEMELGGEAEAALLVDNIIEEDPVLDITATYDDAGTARTYAFGTWSDKAVKLTATDPNSVAGLSIEYSSKVKGGTWSSYVPYTKDIDVTVNGTYYYRFKTVLTKGSDTYETELNEAYAVKVDTTAPGEVLINQFDAYSDPDAWTSTPVNLTTTFDKEVNGANEWVEVKVDDGTWEKKSGILISDAGKHVIKFRTVDELGRVTVAKNKKDTVYVNIDTTSAGNVTMKIGSDTVKDGNPNNISFDKYYKKGDKIELKLIKTDGTEDTNGKIYYNLAANRDAPKSDAWVEYKGTFDIPDNFRGSLYAYGVNQSGKVTETIRSNGFTLDSEAPQIVKPTSMSTWNKSDELDIEITDNLSGLDAASLKYTRYADDTTTTPLESPQTFTLTDGKGTITLPNGDYYIEIEASDKAGNKAAINRIHVMIDANAYAFTVNQTAGGDHAVIKVDVTQSLTGISGIEGIYIRSNGSSWQLISAAPHTTGSYDAYKNGLYQVKVVNKAGKDSSIQDVTVSGLSDDLPTFGLKTTDGFEFGDFWYQPLTILVQSNADEIYYSTNGNKGPWKPYEDKIEITETSAYQFTFKVKTGDKEYISLPYDTRVIVKQPSGTPSVVKSGDYRMFMRSVFSAYSSEKEEWYQTGQRIKFSPSSESAPGMKVGVYIQVLEADENGNGIGYSDQNFTFVDEKDPYYTFDKDGRFVIYKFYAYYMEGKENEFSTPEQIDKVNFNIDGTAPEYLRLQAEVDGSNTILNNLTGGLFFKEPVKIIPEGRDSLSGIDHYEFQNVECSEEECEVAKPLDDGWITEANYLVPQDFEGVVYVRAVDAAKNYLEKSVQLAVKEDTTTYKILEDISSWTNTKDLNIEVTPSTTGLQELQYVAYEDDKEHEASRIHVPATDTENKLFTIHDIPEGVYNLKVIPVENGGTSINRGAHALKVDRTKPVVQVKLEQNNTDAAAKLMNRMTLNSFYRPGLLVSASATDMAGALKIDPQDLKIEYSLQGAEWKEYTTPLRFDEEDVINVSFRAIDQAGNISDTVTQDGIAIDATAPTFEGAGNNVTYWLPRTVSVKDTLSGVDTVKLNDKRVSSTVLVKDYGTSRIDATDRSGNESAIAFTIKGLNDIKDEDITNDLIKEIEKEFEEQKPGYDAELTDKIQKEIDDLKDRNQDTSTPGNDGQGDHDGSNQNPSGDGNGSDGSGNNGSNGGSQTPGTDGTNGGNGTGNGMNGNGSGNDGTGTNGSGNNGNGSSGTTNTGTNSGTGQSSGVMRTGTTQTVASGVKTGDYTSILAFLALGLLSAMLAVAVKLKQRLNALQKR